MEKTFKKHLIIASILAGVGVVSAILAPIQFASLNKGDESSSAWMKKIDDETKINEIALPGSHDSAALYGIADLSGQCQDLNIAAQLGLGVRALDIRLRVDGEKLRLIHGIVDQRAYFSEILDVVYAFLESNPSEALVMMVKNEDGKEADKFTSLMEATINKNKNRWYLDTAIPTLKEVRGKIVLFGRYDNPLGLNLHNGWQDGGDPSKECTFDIEVSENKVHIQDHYVVAKAEDKWNEFVACLDYAKDIYQAPNSTYCLNYLSATYDGGFPPSLAVKVAKDLNYRLPDKIKEYKDTGYIFLDFVSSTLISSIYRRNF
ncbi:MAG: phosphatidylinositol-specific phospholipase C [Bacilli bacterium]|nr:phosphatidylinositol-specific phospholipase C [Bacilli bacterium]